jgi:integrase/recombinase XerD
MSQVLRGVLDGHRLLRVSARTRSWKEAEFKARELEFGEREVFTGVKGATVESAVVAYLADQEARHLSRGTLAQSRAFLAGEFLTWCYEHRLLHLSHVLLPQIREFRHSWDIGARTAVRRHERLRSLFTFCMSNGWIQGNPMNGLKKPVVRKNPPTEYFNRQEFTRILNATREYHYRGGRDCRHRAGRLRALILLMRWSGLAIKDAIILERKAMDGRGALLLRRAKTGVPVFVPLPPAVVSNLLDLPPASSKYFFWSANGDPRSAVQGYERSFRKLFLLANLKNPDGTPKRCHAHMFRDTFAVELLLAGAPIDQVSALLGHHSIKMTEKHYLPWVRARQRQLTATVRRAWFPEVRGSAPEREKLSEKTKDHLPVIPKIVAEPG